MSERFDIRLVAINPDKYSLGLACLEAMLKTEPRLKGQVGVTQHLYDLEKVRSPYYDLTTIVHDIVKTGADLAGISCYSWNLDLCVQLARILRSVRPGIRLVVGGAEVQLDAGEVLEDFPEGTYFVAGEGEEALCKLVQFCLANGDEDQAPCDIGGVGRLNSGKVRFSNIKTRALDLERLPSPILSGTLRTEGLSWIPSYATTRGCLYNCSYCRWGDEFGLRALPLARVEAELDELARLDVNRIWITDTIFGRDLDRDLRILDRLNDWPRPVQFSFELHHNFVNERLVCKLARLSLGWIGLGVQSTEPAALKGTRRSPDIESVRRAIGLLHEGLDDPRCIHLDLIFGLPGDSVNSVLGTLDLLKGEFPLASFYCSLLHILPGTPFWRVKRSEGWLCQEAQWDHELVCRHDLAFDEAQFLKTLILGVDFLQYGPVRPWSDNLQESSGRSFSELAKYAGSVCRLHDLHRHQTYNRHFYFDDIFGAAPCFLTQILSEIEKKVKADQQTPAIPDGFLLTTRPMTDPW